jgi:hypothetical protein
MNLKCCNWGRRHSEGLVRIGSYFSGKSKVRLGTVIFWNSELFTTVDNVCCGMQPVQANGMYVLRKEVQKAATGSCVRRRCCPSNVIFFPDTVSPVCWLWRLCEVHRLCYVHRLELLHNRVANMVASKRLVRDSVISVTAAWRHRNDNMADDTCRSAWKGRECYGLNGNVHMCSYSRV